MIIEALVVGVVASVIGLFLGLLLASGLFWLFDAVGFTLPNTGLVLETRTVIVALLAGILVTLLASLRPALRDARAADRGRPRGRDAPARSLRALPGVGAALTVAAGFAALLYGLFGSGLGTTQVLIWMGLGAFLIFLGVALFSSHLVRPLARVLGNENGRRRGPPRPRQLVSQHTAHRIDGRGPHDRPRARDAGGDPGGRHRQLVQGRRQRPVARLGDRLRAHRAEQLQPDPDRRQTTSRPHRVSTP